MGYRLLQPIGIFMSKYFTFYSIFFVLAFICLIIKLISDEKIFSIIAGICFLIAAGALAGKIISTNNLRVTAIEEKWDVYINGDPVNIENIDLEKYQRVTYDEENKKVIITVN